MHPARWNLKNQRAGQPQPLADVDTGVVVGVSPVATSLTLKVMPFSLTQRPALAARLGGVGGGHLLKGDSSENGLVLRFLFKVEVGPVVAVLSRVPLSGLALFGLPNVGQVLEANPTAVLLGEQNKLFGDDVVDVPYRASLLAAIVYGIWAEISIRVYRHCPSSPG